MPVEAAPAAPHSVHVIVSPINELGFALFCLTRYHLHPEKWQQPWLQDLAVNEPEVSDQASSFWNDGFDEWLELLILADKAGHHWNDELDGLFQRLEQAASRPMVVPPLPSEPDDVRPRIIARLERLQSDAEFRASYVALLRRTWELLLPTWRGSGKQAAEQQAQDLRRRLSTARDFRELLPVTHFARREGHRSLVEECLESGQVFLIPLALAGIGMGLFALPGMLFVCLGPEAEQKHKQGREAAERVAGRLKVLSDPTRVAILRSLMSCNNTITDLALAYDLSQPTVSVHVKLLREAGLLESTRERGLTTYSARRETVQEYLKAASEDLVY